MKLTDLLEELDNGRVLERLSEEVREITEAVVETGETGALTIKLSISREAHHAVVDVSSVPKVPKHPMHGTLMFFDGKGGLTREDPRQLKLRNLNEPRVHDARAKTE